MVFSARVTPQRTNSRQIMSWRILVKRSTMAFLLSPNVYAFCFSSLNNIKVASSFRDDRFRSKITGLTESGTTSTGTAISFSPNVHSTLSLPSFLVHRQHLLRGGAMSSSTKHNLSTSSSSTDTSIATASSATSTSTRKSSTDTDNNNSKDIKTETTNMTPSPKLSALRSKMKSLGIHCYVIPTDDPHLSEYVPEAYMRRAFLTGFTGSAGTAIVTADEAFLWTDSRYFNEAGLQLDADHWTLMKQGLPKVPTIIKFLTKQATDKYKSEKEVFQVGLDAYVHSASFAKELTEAFEKAAADIGDTDDQSIPTVGTINTLDSESNLIDEIWGNERPPIPTSPFRVHPIEYAGCTVEDKLDEIRDQMKEKKATLSVFSALDDVAYLLNVRAMGDVSTCPVGIAYATVEMDTASIYCDPAKICSDQVRAHFENAGIVIKPYDSIVPDITTHISAVKRSKVWIDKKRANYAISRIIPDANIIDEQNAVTPMKSTKNAAEMEGMRKAHIVDGVAMAHFISWLENQIVNNGKSVSEVEIDEVLMNYRAQQPGYLEDSFPTIAGVGSNGAIIHYRAKKGSDLMKFLDHKNPILIDSGGQYEYGTTDVTRTWHFGQADSKFIDCYTRVLKGNIGVDSMIFPENTPGFVLDVFARKFLWEAGIDYGHGTGHGVGAALNVHEGPQSISPRWANKEVLKKGMVLSNEPGYYEDGNFGIRIENLLEVTYVQEEDNNAYDNDIKEGDEGFPKKELGQKTFLKFNKLTMIPIQKSLIDVKLMSVEELDWVDTYHQEVFDKVSPLLEKDSLAFEWLSKSCAKIERT